MKNKIEYSLENIEKAAKWFVEKAGTDSIFLFEGEMGAGKTTLISEICRQLGVTDDVGSPTFSLINEYGGDDGEPIYHFDFYRIDSPREALDMGVEEYFNSGCLCLVEWPDRLGHLKPCEAREVKITTLPDGTRSLEM